MFSDDSVGTLVIDTVPANPAQRTRLRLKRQAPGLFYTVAVLAGATMLLAYFIVRNLALFGSGYTTLDHLSAICLFVSELYASIQGIGYYRQVLVALRQPNVARQTRLAKHVLPPIAVYIATYNEPEAIIDETINAVSLMDYPDFTIYVNCDHPSPEQGALVEAAARRHGVHSIHRVPNTGFKAGGINAFLERLGRDLPAADYLCIFDADSLPLPSFLREIMPYFEQDPRIAYVQAPQFYGNRDQSLVADAAGHQQATFGEYISEGKQESGGMFYCGTNVVFRAAALRDIGGLLINSITEDFNTSIKLHSRGWKSQYCNSAYVVGMGPTTLQAYWTQQGRWALGNLESFRMSLGALFWKPGLSLVQRWEYVLSGTYFFVGWNSFFAMVCPALFLLFGIRPLIMSPLVYALAYVPHFLFSNYFFFISMGQRGFRPRILFLAQCLTFVTFPIFMSAATAAVLKQKKAFAVTPKRAAGAGGSTTLPLLALWPHLVMLVFLGCAVVMGSIQVAMHPDLSILVNVAWCAYHIALLSTIWLFNQPEEMAVEAGRASMV